jgi:methyl-accepting chemotaxis protein
MYWLGSHSTEELNNKVNNITGINSKRLALALKISEDLQYVSKREKDICLSPVVSEKEKFADEAETRIATTTERIGELKSLADEKGQAIIEDFENRWNSYQQAFQVMKNLAIANTDSSNQAAYRISSGDMRSNVTEAREIIYKIVKKNEAELAKAADETTILYESSRSGMLLSLILAIILSVLIVYWIVNSISKSLNEAKSTIKKVADGDLTQEIRNDTKDEIGELMEQIGQMVDRLKEIIGHVSNASEQIAAASEQMSSSSQSLSHAATEQASSAEEVSASMEEMMANILQNTENAQQTEKIAIKAAEDIQKGSTAVDKTVSTMKQIAGKINIIEEIARQTNLLALNAAVEAARAGEHGKGFAVVAAEVRKLAERSQTAANEITSLSAESVVIAEQSGKLLSEIVPDIQKTARLVQEISAASIEQNAGADQINNAIQQLNQIIQQNAATSEEMAAGSEELSGQADHLTERIGYFKTGNLHENAIKNRKTHSVKTFSNVPGKTGRISGSGNGKAYINMSGHDIHDNDFERIK